MPEGDTIYRTAEVLGRVLAGEEIVAARGRPGGARLDRVVGSRVSRVRAQGKHLLIEFDGGLTLHTHMKMKGSWHRYRPGERWREPADKTVAVLETDRAVAVCFEAPTVELLDTRALSLHPGLARLGPDLLGDAFDTDTAAARFGRLPAETTIAEALLDQEVVAGIGNVYRSEILAHDLVSPFGPARAVPIDVVADLLRTAQAMMRSNRDGAVRRTVPGAKQGERWVYRRAGRPCRRCGTIIRSAMVGTLPRRLYWCPTCQC